jgi:hypothetical protein
MHFLINEVDNSVNCVQETPFTLRAMVHAGLLEKELPIDHIPEGTNLYHCFYDPNTNSIILDPNGVRTALTADELKDLTTQYEQIQQAVQLSREEKLTKLAQRMLELHPDDPVFKEILSDNVVSTDEMKQIEDMLNGVK